MGAEILLAAQADVRLLDQHMNVVKEETAWAEGDSFDGANWATYAAYVVEAVITVDPTGCTFEVEDPESPLNGFKLAIPPDAVDQEISVHVFPTEIDQDLPPKLNVECLGEAIAVEKDQGGDFLAPVEITIPVGDAFSAGSGILILSYDQETDTWEMPMITDIDSESKTMTITTLHLTDYISVSLLWDTGSYNSDFIFDDIENEQVFKAPPRQPTGQGRCLLHPPRSGN